MRGRAGHPIDLLAARLNRGLSRRQAADQMGVAENTLKRAEEGEMPHPSNALKIAGFYGHQVTDVWPLEPTEAAA